MSAAMQREWPLKAEAPNPTPAPSAPSAPGAAGDRQADPRQMAVLETILVDYRPVFRELASR